MWKRLLRWTFEMDFRSNRSCPDQHGQMRALWTIKPWEHMCCQEEARISKSTEFSGAEMRSRSHQMGTQGLLRKSLPRITSLASFQFRKMSVASMWERNKKGSMLSDKAKLHWHLLPSLPQTHENPKTKIRIIWRIHKTEQHSPYRKAGHSGRGIHEPPHNS